MSYNASTTDAAAMPPASASSLRWIPIEDRIPPSDHIVLWAVETYGGGLIHTIGRLCADGERIVSTDGVQFWATAFTYWMPLPALPKASK